MIILNGKKFAANQKEFIDSLFESGGTCDGYYQIRVQQIILMDHQKNRIGGINQEGVLFRSTRPEWNNGKLWHQCANPTMIGPYDSYMKQCDEVREAQRIAGTSKTYWI